MTEKASLKRLQLSNFKLEALLSITLSINENLSTQALLSKYENIIRKDLGIGKVVLFNYNKKWQCILASGLKDDNYLTIQVESDLLPFREITNLTISQYPKLQGFDVVIPVFHKSVPLAFVLLGDIEEERDGISPIIKHLNFFQTLTNILVVAIENKRLYTENIQQESIKKELDLARQMQSMLIPHPDALPKNNFLYVTSYYQPHYEVGGDYYDFFYLNEFEVGFCIADVSGKGISAALLMSNFQASLRALFTTDIELNQLICRLNGIINNNTKGEKFITAFIGKYNIQTRMLKFINAGHNPPLLFIPQNEYQYLKTGCAGLGMLPEIPQINIGSIIIPQNARLVCYTDGLVEMENELHEEFGTKEMEQMVEKEDNLDLFVWKIIQRVNVYRGKMPFFDDISLLCIEFK
ncbi:MAG TPA: PP2C family protein-serine/threonine phosphatase [Bacteroidales bacterium]|jgi:sigma-B regulation protein RsbU (phosphoserine phosphatase)|nr:PP2C family protein-serine/threonine phosphatase [Bacteroidales bacterium]HNV96173.1 PP2C family protein-serine/threonine phosphatase [Bacteroidales bacterium]HOU97528.1 PP2C family protein-serine/threonine phosphatase [Bacteroidales bacterium]